MEKNGLTSKEVIEKREKYGSNMLSKVKKQTFLKLLLSSLGDPIIRILLIALGIKMVFLMKDFDWYETIGIVIAIFLASFISSISEYGSEKAFEKLQEESSKIKCRVKRDQTITEIPIDDVVKDDIVLLESGDRIPADGILIEGSISVDESSLNGESKEKNKTKILGSIGDENRVYRGSVVCSGRAFLLVTEVGDQTIYGKLATEIQEESDESPLKIRLRHLAGIISKIGYIGAILVSFSYLFSVIVIENHFQWNAIVQTVSNFPLMAGHILYALTLTVTVIVVAVPEGLPMMITLVLSSNMKRMLKNNVLVRKLVGIETAGSLNILFTDKTGTLTKGKLEVVDFMSGDKEYVSAPAIAENKNFYNLVKLSLVYNNASNYDENNIPIGGNITDKSLLLFMKDKSPILCKKISTIPFDSKKKYMITTIEYQNEQINFIKGAPELLIDQCIEYYDENGKRKVFREKDKIKQAISNATNSGIRVLAFATSKQYNPENLQNLTFVGIVFIKDEVRKEAIEGIKLVKNAHIRTVMITGDNEKTARAIGREIGLIKNEQDLVMTSEELNRKTDEEIKQLIPHLKIVARSLPQDKSRLVRLSKEMGLVVGMTGDGVNDAPALKKADVGFAMGSGTEIAKEASDIVILDDNFLSITKAILFGRTIFKSIRKFIIFQLTVNFCAITLSIIGPFIGVETPVTVIQMLWINMVMDTLAGIAFAYEPPLIEYMDEFPKKKEEPIINRYMFDQIIWTGIYSTLLCILFLKVPFFHQLFREGENDKYLMTAFFGLFIFLGIFNCFNARTHRLNLFAYLYKNRVFIIVILFVLIVQVILIYYGGEIFRTFGLTFKEFESMFFLAFSVVPIDWIRKVFLRKKGIIGGV